MITFDALSENISGIDCNGNRFGKPVDGISAWYMENDYNKLVTDSYEADGVEIEYNGVKYVDHWFFVNESHESSVCGYSLLPADDDGFNDVIFYVCGSKVDSVVSFDEMIDYLTNEAYFID
jgi:hypothetical protein